MAEGSGPDRYVFYRVASTECCSCVCKESLTVVVLWAGLGACDDAVAHGSCKVAPDNNGAVVNADGGLPGCGYTKGTLGTAADKRERERVRGGMDASDASGVWEFVNR